MKIIRTFALILFLTLLIGCNALTVDNQQKNNNLPKDFGFTLKYGVGAKNVVDTFKGTYEKDLVSAGTEKTKLKLSSDELMQIYNKMQSIGILEYPDKYAPAYSDNPEPGVIRITTPHNTYHLHLAMNGTEKDIYWDDKNSSEVKKAKELRELFNYIDGIIINKDEYKKLPAVVGGYE